MIYTIYSKRVTILKRRIESSIQRFTYNKYVKSLTQLQVYYPYNKKFYMCVYVCIKQ